MFGRPVEPTSNVATSILQPLESIAPQLADAGSPRRQASRVEMRLDELQIVSLHFESRHPTTVAKRGGLPATRVRVELTHGFERFSKLDGIARTQTAFG